MDGTLRTRHNYEARIDYLNLFRKHHLPPLICGLALERLIVSASAPLLPSVPSHSNGQRSMYRAQKIQAILGEPVARAGA
jgi:hypothetical protein